MKYITMSFQNAARMKWVAGVKEYREGDAGRSFEGDACEEAYQECIDLYCYLAEASRQTGTEFTRYKAMCEEIALALQRAHRVFPRTDPREKRTD